MQVTNPYALLSILIVLFSLNACDESTGGDCQVLPSTYNIYGSSVTYPEQTEQLTMLSELSTYMKQVNSGNSVDASVLKAMFDNSGSVFTTTFSSNLKANCADFMQPIIEGRMDKLATASASTSAGSNGVAGLVSSSDGSAQYLFDENGMEHVQLIEKGIMGAVLYYQVVDVLLDEVGLSGNDANSTWDKAYGYLGAPLNFPTNTDDLLFWANYCNQRNDILNTNRELANAFLQGKCGILNDDNTYIALGIKNVREEWERVVVSTAISYLNAAVSNIADDALRNHELSEALAFIECLAYSPLTHVDSGKASELWATIGTNLYEVSIDDIQAVKDELSSLYDLDAVSDSL